MEYIKKLHMACFDLLEFKQLYKNDNIKNMRIAMAKFGFNYLDLHNDKEKRNEIVNYIINERSNKEDIEIFIALTSGIAFFGNNSKICFVLKNNFNVKKDHIKSINDLKMVIKEDTLVDFAIWNNGLRQFQLKQYRLELKTNQLFKFIEKVLGKYGNNLGDVNLLIQLQGSNGGKFCLGEKIKIVDNDIDYHEINLRLKKLKLNFKGHILIKYNEINKFSVLNQVYPRLRTTRKPIDQDYFAGEILYN